MSNREGGFGSGPIGPIPPVWCMDSKEYTTLSNMSSETLAKIIIAISEHNKHCWDLKVALTETIDGIIEVN